MKVFISWSGDRSKDLANALAKFLRAAFGSESPDVYMSEHIKPGIRWAEELGKELASTQFGVLCLTPENLNAPWLLFEAGSLAKSVNRSTVVPYRLGVSPDDIPFPLAQFQGRDANETGTWDLLQEVNAGIKNPLDDQQLYRVFEKQWPSLKSEIENIKKSGSSLAVTKIEQERQRVRKICARIAGAWWELIPGDGLSFFQIQMDERHNSVLLKNGEFYKEQETKEEEREDADITWESVAARITEENDTVEIVYLRRCKDPEHDPKEWFHGYGDITFRGATINKGRGMFFDVNRDDPRKTLKKSVYLRRVNEEEYSEMQNGTLAAKNALVTRVMENWKHRK